MPQQFEGLIDLFQKISAVQERILSIMSSTNSVIAKLQSDFSSFSSDFGTFATQVQAFIASVTSGANGTVLSPADAAALAQIDTQVDALDATVKGIAVPPPAAPAPTTAG